MEEVWKDINPSSLHSRSGHDFSPVTANFRHIILQDFLSSSTSKVTDSSTAADMLPPTLLTLNSSRELHFPDNAVVAAHFYHQNATFHSPFDQVLGSPPFRKKRVPDSDPHYPGDRRQKRMIKNRESAARSRARRQAYRNALQFEVKKLMEENSRLKRQQEELGEAASVQIPRRHRLQRTTTWPF